METIKKFKGKIHDWTLEFLEMEEKGNMKLKHSFDFQDQTLIFNISIINRKTAWTRGCSNKTKDNYFCSFFDYDRMKKSYVKEELKILQEQFNLGDLLIFKSSENNYQAVGFGKLTLHEFQEVLMHSSCDYAFIKFPKYLPYAKYYVLRQFSKGNTPAPEFLYVLKAKTDREQSLAHWKYFKALYPKMDVKLTKSDNLEKVMIVDYPTSTNT